MSPALLLLTQWNDRNFLYKCLQPGLKHIKKTKATEVWNKLVTQKII